MITKDMTWGEIEEELKSYGILLGFGWHIMMSNFLEKCDYIEIVGHGDFAQLRLMKNGIEVEFDLLENIIDTFKSELESDD